jgi:quinoprotein glucose dehydrogenase
MLHPVVRWSVILLATVSITACGSTPAVDYSGPTATWTQVGSDAGGARFSPLTQVNRNNVEALEIAWEYHTGDVSDGKGDIPSTSAFEATPIVVEDTMYLCSPFNRVIALDPETGTEKWTHDPKIDLQGRYANQLVCRGVTYWKAGVADGVCAETIFTATNDARLIALDAKSGAPCADFGDGGTVDLTIGIGETQWDGEYQVTSAPTVVGELVVVGSAISDNARVNAPSGVVRAYDARTGVLAWAWDPAPEEMQATLAESDSAEQYVLGTPNAWGPMSFDEDRDLLFMPTGNGAPDFYGGHRNGIDEYASSVVALRASTGEVVWSFQTVHHDVWDFDVAAQPTLTTIPVDGEDVPVVIQATKMGLIFVLHRETGKPVFPVEERPVPQGGVEGERLSATQPFPTKPPRLTAPDLDREGGWGIMPWSNSECQEALQALRYEGIYTPPSLEGSLMFPGNAGGTNWGGASTDTDRHLLLVNVLNLAFKVRLFPSADYERERRENPGKEISPQAGTPYGMERELVVSSMDIPCTPPPWGTLAAVDLTKGEIAWQRPFGSIEDLVDLPVTYEIGLGNLGGPMTTAGGLTFIGGLDNSFRAFDTETGDMLWKDRLPAGSPAIPMTYRLRDDSKQFVVISAGGFGKNGMTKMGDSLVAFALPD